jgi:hypothetical protein
MDQLFGQRIDIGVGRGVLLWMNETVYLLALRSVSVNLRE